jgi:hypothetical protein
LAESAIARKRYSAQRNGDVKPTARGRLARLHQKSLWQRRNRPSDSQARTLACTYWAIDVITAWVDHDHVHSHDGGVEHAHAHSHQTELEEEHTRAHG